MDNLMASLKEVSREYLMAELMVYLVVQVKEGKKACQKGERRVGLTKQLMVAKRGHQKDKWKGWQKGIGKGLKMVHQRAQ
jgi:hypothetical protein